MRCISVPVETESVVCGVKEMLRNEVWNGPLVWKRVRHMERVGMP
jgi:hypothetical protein